jgi:hypothetical protein
MRGNKVNCGLKPQKINDFHWEAILHYIRDQQKRSLDEID